MTEEKGRFGDLYIRQYRQKFRDGNASCAEGKFNRVKSIRTDPREEDKSRSLYLLMILMLFESNLGSLSEWCRIGLDDWSHLKPGSIFFRSYQST